MTSGARSVWCFRTSQKKQTPFHVKVGKHQTGSCAACRGQAMCSPALKELALAEHLKDCMWQCCLLTSEHTDMPARSVKLLKIAFAAASPLLRLCTVPFNELHENGAKLVSESVPYQRKCQQPDSACTALCMETLYCAAGKPDGREVESIAKNPTDWLTQTTRLLQCCCLKRRHFAEC